MPEFIDIHSHVNFNAFIDDRDAVVKRALDNNTWIINVGTQFQTSLGAVSLAHKYESGVYATVGLHPIHTCVSFHDEKELGEEGGAFTSKGEEFIKSGYEEMARDPKVVALGECGLDYYRLDEESKQKQIRAFEQQIALANDVNKPLMLHIRNSKGESSAYVDSLEILKSCSKVKGNVHFFAGSWEDAKAYLDFGFTLSFTGVITFTRDYDDVVKNTPLTMLMSETDSPYITPVPYRGKRNEPLFVSHVVARIAEIKGGNIDTVKKQLVANAGRVFGLK